MQDRTMTIGEFSRLTGLTAKALRHYDAIELLTPAHVDPGTNYRGYTDAQIQRARTIRRLRDLQLPLEDIRVVLDDPSQADKRLTSYRRDVEADLFRRQRILHHLFQLTEGAEPLTTASEAMPTDTPGGLTPEEERRVAVDLFNHVWELLETPSRSIEQDDRMVHAAHASRYHWERVGDATNLLAGEWQCSRVYSVLERGEPAVHHARRALAIAEGAGITGFFLATSYEALARAHAVAGDRAASDRFRLQANEAAEAITDPEDREIYERDMATLPG
jgi:DNA-binding transcriptional MerR regulator